MSRRGENISAGQKITFDRFLDLVYEHFGIVVSQEHYRRAADDGAVPENENVMFLNANKNAFAQKLKDCGFLRDLSDAEKTECLNILNNELF